MRSRFFVVAALAAIALPTAAFAQNDGAQGESVYDGNYLTVGIGGFYGPSYEGSDDYILYPAPVVQGNLFGVAITPRAGGAALDFIPDAKGARVGFSLGPVATARRDRVRKISDPVVASLGKLKMAVEVGANAGVTVYDLATGYDSLTLSADAKWDVNGAHKGMVWGPSLSYFTPLSKGSAVNLSLYAEHVDDKFAAYYQTVTPAQALVSGLPTYNAKGGWKNVGVNLTAGLDFDGDLTNGGFAGFVNGGYSRLLNDAKRTPFTSVRGDDDQWTIGAGLAYTF